MLVMYLNNTFKYKPDNLNQLTNNVQDSNCYEIVDNYNAGILLEILSVCEVLACSGSRAPHKPTVLCRL